LHERFGSLRLAGLLAPAQRLATAGFPVSTTLAHASAELDPRDRAAAFGDPAPLVAGRRLLLPGVGRALGAIAASGRAGFYEGPRRSGRPGAAAWPVSMAAAGRPIAARWTGSGWLCHGPCPMPRTSVLGSRFPLTGSFSATGAWAFRWIPGTRPPMGPDGARR